MAKKKKQSSEDKYLRYKVSHDVHKKVRSLSIDEDIYIEKLVPQLIAIGLKHYPTTK